MDNSKTYKNDFDDVFKFNDPVEAIHCGGDVASRTGRLIQIRKKAGAWGSDMYFIRRNDGTLHTFENVGLRKYTGEVSEPDESDFDGAEYTVKGEYPEAGFLVEEPCGPPAQVQAFSMTITSHKG